MVENEPPQYMRRSFSPDLQLVCYSKTPICVWKIVLPDELLESAVRWYHLALSHVRSNRLLDTMSMHIYNKKLRSTIESIVSKCDTCQRHKLVGRGHGEVAAREAALLPWREVAN